MPINKFILDNYGEHTWAANRNQVLLLAEAVDNIERLLQFTGGTNTVAIQATELISAYDVVTIDGRVANSSDISMSGMLVGIALEDMAIDEIKQVQQHGFVVNPTWSWTVGNKLFLNGKVLSNEPPSTGFVQRIALVIEPSTILLSFNEPIIL